MNKKNSFIKKAKEKKNKFKKQKIQKFIKKIKTQFFLFRIKIFIIKEKIKKIFSIFFCQKKKIEVQNL